MDASTGYFMIKAAQGMKEFTELFSTTVVIVVAYLFIIFRQRVLKREIHSIAIPLKKKAR